jgi:hypothetical protein
MKFDSYVILNVNGGVYDMKLQYNTYAAWLDARGIQYKSIMEDAYSACPHVLLMMAEDAVAFKLRFGL